MSLWKDDEDSDSTDEQDTQPATPGEQSTGAVQTQQPNPRNNGGGHDQDDDDWQPDDDLLTIEPPRMNTKSWRQWIRTKRWLKKREKLLGDGYIEWWLVGDTVERKFIQPDQKGGGAGVVAGETPGGRGDRGAGSDFEKPTAA